MKVFTGFNKNTAKKLVLDAGAYFKNFTVGTDTYESAKSSGKLLGATQGGGEFAAVPTVRQIEVDGIKGRTKGLEVLQSWEAHLKANILEVSLETIEQSLCTSKKEEVGNYVKITPGDTIELDDYIENITWVGTLSGSNIPIIIQVYNTINTDGFTFTPSDNSEGVIPSTFYGHYTAGDDGSIGEPFAIFYPKDVSAIALGLDEKTK